MIDVNNGCAVYEFLRDKMENVEVDSSFAYSFEVNKKVVVDSGSVYSIVFYDEDNEVIQCESITEYYDHEKERYMLDLSVWNDENDDSSIADLTLYNIKNIESLEYCEDRDDWIVTANGSDLLISDLYESFGFFTGV